MKSGSPRVITPFMQSVREPSTSKASGTVQNTPRGLSEAEWDCSKAEEGEHQAVSHPCTRGIPRRAGSRGGAQWMGAHERRTAGWVELAAVAT